MDPGEERKPLCQDRSQPFVPSPTISCKRRARRFVGERHPFSLCSDSVWFCSFMSSQPWETTRPPFQ